MKKWQTNNWEGKGGLCLDGWSIWRRCLVGGVNYASLGIVIFDDLGDIRYWDAHATVLWQDVWVGQWDRMRENKNLLKLITNVLQLCPSHT
ncbi:hypothetical protein VTJ04DRAFT_3959 [Mycothermus thermophilus]|uniref:uncharacterized protein n=1 Tax=Humicola insolens TaxID=85995 RepID=UPI00374289E9